MRNLTITRIKSAVACTAAMKVYIQDEETQELTIGGVPCRKLGNLKNGETATFAISDRAAKVFVIADKASRNYSNDYYPIPAGTEDVTIAGKNKYSPFIGNPFRFEGVTDPEVLAKLRDVIEADYHVEGDLRREVAMNIKSMVEINCYRGIRHRKAQRTWICPVKD